MKYASLSLVAALAASPAFGQCESKSADACGSTSAASITLASGPGGYGKDDKKPDIVDTAIAAGSFNTLVAAVQAADLVDVLKGKGPFTVFAPTDEAFAKLPEGTLETLLKPENKDQLTAILLYHVVPGEAFAKDVVTKKTWDTALGQRVDISAPRGKPMIDNANIVATDIETSNGVIHVIDTVILPEMKTIPEVAGAAGSFSTLLTAVKTAGLAETLMGEGPYTVFAPTDEAFAALGSTVSDLLKPENREKLTSILTYHVVSGRVYADQAVKAKSAETLEGGSITIKGWGDSVKINDATVLSADVEASNGVIHVIDGVLMP
ncbi:MAG: fasciclin domain-containing protein [Phycisphaerales bacterium]